MKKILLTVAVLAVAVTAGAQNTEKLLSSIDKAQAATENEKKASNPATWIKYGDALTNAFVSLFGDDYKVGWNYSEVMFFNTQQPDSQEQVTVNGVSYTVEHYAFKDLYYNNATGILDAIVVTKPVSDENLLVMARDAYMKAAEFDSNGSKTKAIAGKLLKLKEYMVENALSYNALGDFEKAAEYFEESLSCSDNSIVGIVDTLGVYNTGLMYEILGNNGKAKTYYTQCVEMGFDANGDVSSSLAKILMKEGDVEGAKECLNAAFQKYPESQSVLVELINLYIESNDDPQKILDLIKAAQANEPDNASLVYAEGNVYYGMGDMEKAIECFYKSYEMDSTYAYGIFWVGNTYLEMGVAVQGEIDKLDLRDVEGYETLVKKMDNYFLSSIDPYEKAFAISTDEELKIVAATALKQVYFRFRDKDPKYAEGYDKYEAYLKEKGVVTE